jgi:hypothetical protein
MSVTTSSLVGWIDEVAVVPVLDAQQLGAHLVEAAGLLPEFGGLHHGHREFDGAGAVHLLAHDRLDLADHAQAHRHVRVDARAELLDHAGAHHQPMARDLGVGGRFLEGGDQELGSFHRDHGGIQKGSGGLLSPESLHRLAEGNPACIMTQFKNWG